MKKFIKAFIACLCFTFIFAGTVFATTNTTAAITQTSANDNALLQKQAEIDKYVFEDHAKEIAQKGFKVTSTGQIGNFVEIAITPFNKANADYLYSIFGSDKVKVVDGTQAQLLVDSGVATTSVVDDKASAKTGSNPLIYGLAAVVVLGAGGLLIIRKKSAHK